MTRHGGMNLSLEFGWARRAGRGALRSPPIGTEPGERSCCRAVARNPMHYGPVQAGPFNLRVDGSGQRRIDHDVAGDLERALVGVAFALDAGVPLQGAADVVLRVDDGPVVVELDPFELGEVAAAAGPLGVLDVREVGADLGCEKLVVARNGDQRVVGEQLGDEPAKCRVEGRAAAGGVGEQRPAARVEMPAQRVEVLLAETTTPRGRGCRSAGSRSGWGRAGTGLSG